jgi:penicillin-binding protein 1A
MRKTDINKYSGPAGMQGDRISTGKSIAGMIFKGLLTVFVIFVIAGIIVAISLAAFIGNLKNSSVNLDLQKLKLNYTTFVYTNGNGDDRTHPMQYISLYSDENRVWVDYNKIPQAMKDAIVSIEDKRFWEHNGVDWKRTVGAAANLFHIVHSSSGYGGSTITQQLIKNMTGDDEVSLTRKITEIFRAKNLEKKYSKQQILEAYLNVVNFGSGCNGVETAAKTYYDKDIKDCDIAQCAAIAGITQNPAAYNPTLHPEANKKRQQTVIKAMHDQKRITDKQYQDAMNESEHMQFAAKKKASVHNENKVWDWYTDAMIEDVKQGLMKAYNCSSDHAIDLIYHGGLKIYSAMNQELQKDAEKAFTDNTTFPASYPNLQGGYTAMDYSGRMMAIIGSRGKKTSDRLFNFATDAKRQPGSSIKPLAVYAPAVNLGKVTYSSLINDEPVPNWKGGKSGPDNWNHVYHGKITVEYALEQSWNAAAVQLFKEITPAYGLDFMRQKLGFTSLESSDYNLAAAIGGLTHGVTVREMTAGYQIFGNGGKYYKPYTYYYVTDHDGNVINGMDNRSEMPVQAISPSSATIMNKLLENVMRNGTGRQADLSDWQTFGKTGTTNSDIDSWFVGGTPYVVAGVWTGYATPRAQGDYQASFAKKIWRNIMKQYIENKPKKTFSFDPNVISASFNPSTGMIVPAGSANSKTGWFDKNNMPKNGNADDYVSSSSSSEIIPKGPESSSSRYERSSWQRPYSSNPSSEEWHQYSSNPWHNNSSSKSSSQTSSQEGTSSNQSLASSERSSRNNFG